MNTKIEQMHISAAQQMDFPSTPTRANSHLHAQVTQNISVKFAEWIEDNHFIFHLTERKWYDIINDEEGKKRFTTIELFNEFQKTL